MTYIEAWMCIGMCESGGRGRRRLPAAAAAAAMVAAAAAAATEMPRTRRLTPSFLTSLAWGPGPELKSVEFSGVSRLVKKLENVTVDPRYSLSLPGPVHVLGILPSTHNSVSPPLLVNPHRLC